MMCYMAPPAMMAVAIAAMSAQYLSFDTCCLRPFSTTCKLHFQLLHTQCG